MDVGYFGMLFEVSVLQADATVIAGLLVLLTILYALTPLSWEANLVEKLKTRRRLAIVMLTIVTPFSLSAFSVVLGNVSNGFLTSEKLSVLLLMGKGLMLAGFLYLVGGLLWLVFNLPGPKVAYRKNN
ncbi:MAG: hypothetical protein WAM14_24550 [Candidatus Nitrosopolaris sp.]